MASFFLLFRPLLIRLHISNSLMEKIYKTSSCRLHAAVIKHNGCKCNSNNFGQLYTKSLYSQKEGILTP